MGKGPFDRGHPVSEAIDGVADLVEEIEEFGGGDGFIRAGLPQDVGALALTGDHQSLGGQLSDRVPCGHDRDAVPRGQLGEGGKLVAGLVCAGRDGAAEVLSDALVGRPGISGIHLHDVTVSRELAKL